MSSESAITVDNVSKLYRKQNQRTFKELIPALFGGKKVWESFWALKDINFEVKKGETVGIIGPNGSGKSTLLKLIAGVTQPTKGKITVNGRIAPLIELGAGFHPELTGRENVFLNGWDFIDQPVKHYSSGMYLRLAFAVAVHTDPEILLVDEILAVGDAKFQEKCFAKMQAFQEAGKTIVIVTHDLTSVQSFCEDLILLKNGEVSGSGSPDRIVGLYLQQ